MATVYYNSGPATRDYGIPKMNEIERFIAFIFITGLGFLSILWMQLRYVYHRDIDPRPSMVGLIVMHGFQAIMLISLGLFTGVNRIVKQIDLTEALPVFAILYFIANLVAYVLKIRDYDSIIDARFNVNEYHRKRKEQTENDISKIT